MANTGSYDAIMKGAKQAFYQRNPDNTIGKKIDDIFAELRADSNYASYEDEDLRILIADRLWGNYINYFRNRGDVSKISIDKPVDDFWSGFTAEEILEMYYDGNVTIPKEFVEWATAQVNSDVTQYEIDETVATNENEISELGIIDVNPLDQKKKIQKYSSKVDAQEEFLDDKTNEVNDANYQLEQEQEDLEKQQKDVIAKINEYTKEIENIERKIENGEELSSSELDKYEQLGNILIAQNKELVSNARSVESDVEYLFENVKDVNDLVNTTQRMEDSLSTLSSYYGPSEVAINPKFGVGNDVAFGKIAELKYAAQSQNTAANAIRDAFDLKDIIDTAKFSEQTREQLQYNVRNSVNNIVSEDVPKSNVNLNLQQQTNDDKTVLNNQNNDEPKEPSNTNAATVVTQEYQKLSSEGVEPPVAEEDVEPDTVEENITEENPEEVQEENSETDDEAQSEIDESTAIIQEYIENSSAKTEEVRAFRDEFKDALIETQKMRLRAIFEDAIFKQSLNARLQEFTSLQNEVKNAKISNPEDITKYSERKDNIAAGADMLLGSLGERIEKLDNFSQLYSNGLDMSQESLDYGRETVRAGYDYVIEKLREKDIDEDNRSALFNINLQEIKPGLDAMVSGAELSKDSSKSLIDIRFNKGADDFAQDKSETLGETREAARTDTDAADDKVEEELSKKQADVKPEEMAKDEAKNSNSNEAITDEAPDANNVISQGKDANTQSKEAEKQDKTAKSEQGKANSDEIKNINTLRRNEAQINRLNNDSDKNIQLQNRLNAEALLLQDELTSIQEESEVQPSEEEQAVEFEAPQEAPEYENEVISEETDAVREMEDDDNNEVVIPVEISSKPVKRNMNSAATGAAAPVLPSNNSTPNDNSSNQARVEEINSRLTSINNSTAMAGKKVNSNNTRISNLRNSSISLNRRMQATMQQNRVNATTKQKSANDSASKDKSAIGVITQVGKGFSAVKYSGLAMMMVPWSAAIGEVMFNVGQYGEIACYTTNTALYAAQGNWLSAAASLGSAALSWTGAAQGIGSAAGNIVKNIAVKKGLTEAATKTAVTVATNVTTSAAAAGMEAGKNGLLNYAEKQEKADNEKETRRKTFVRFERNKLNRIKNRVQKVNKPAKLKG